MLSESLCKTGYLRYTCQLLLVHILFQTTINKQKSKLKTKLKMMFKMNKND